MKPLGLFPNLCTNSSPAEILPSEESNNHTMLAGFPVRRTIPFPRGYAEDLAFFPDLCGPFDATHVNAGSLAGLK